MSHVVTAKLERLNDEGQVHQPGAEREKVDFEPGYIPHRVKERWLPVCSCGFEGTPRRRRIEALREGRRHKALWEGLGE